MARINFQFSLCSLTSLNSLQTARRQKNTNHWGVWCLGWRLSRRFALLDPPRRIPSSPWIKERVRKTSSLCWPGRNSSCHSQLRNSDGAPENPFVGSCVRSAGWAAGLMTAKKRRWLQRWSCPPVLTCDALSQNYFDISKANFLTSCPPLLSFFISFGLSVLLLPSLPIISSRSPLSPFFSFFSS